MLISELTKHETLRMYENVRMYGRLFENTNLQEKIAIKNKRRTYKIYETASESIFKNYNSRRGRERRKEWKTSLKKSENL